MSNMNLSSSCVSEIDAETKALNSLLDAFGSFCSLEEIASAYCRVGSDVNRAGEILCQLHGDSSNGMHNVGNGESAHAQSEESLYEDNAECPSLVRKNSKATKPKKMSAAVGTVSSVLGKAYAHRSSYPNESSGTTKPLKIEVDESLMGEHWMEPVISDHVSRKESIGNKDLENFLFSMLGDGFKLKMDVIREVLGHCGYDAKESMEELLTLSEKTLGKGIDCDTTEFTDKNPKMKSCFSEENLKFVSTERSSSLNKETCNPSREVLEALFTVPARTEEEPKRTRLALGLNRTRAVSTKTVSRPLDCIDLATSIDIGKSKYDTKDVVDVDGNYKVLRGATKQNWDIMKAYYEAAMDAFIRGDRTQANYLLEEGNRYSETAREANEKSSGEIFETRSTDDRSDLLLNLHAHQPKEALHLLKFHLRTLASNSSFRLKVIAYADTEDITKGKLKRMLTKFLEKESIQWTEEEGNPGTIFIPLDVIDSNKLSFVKVPM